MEMSRDLLLVVATTALWSILYLILRQATLRRTPEWTVRVLAFAFSILIFLLATLNYSYFNPPNLDNLGQPNTKYEEIVFTLILGYYVFDLLWIIRYQTEDPIIYVHHAISIFSSSFVLASGVCGSEFLAAIILLVGSNPFLQVRWFLRTHGYRGTWMYTLSEWAFLISFVILRFVCGFKLMISVVLSKNIHLLGKLGTLFFVLVSLVFLYQIFSYTVKAYFRKECK